MITEENDRTSTPTLLELFTAAFAIGMFSFGGGLAAWMHRDFVVKRAWMSERNFFADMAVARVLPGTNVSNFIVIGGFRMRGLAGAAVGLLGLLTAPFIIVIAFAITYEKLDGPILRAALDGAAAATLGLLSLFVFRSVKSLGRKWLALAIMAAVCLAIVFFQIPMPIVIVALLPVSIAASAYTRQRHA